MKTGRTVANRYHGKYDKGNRSYKGGNENTHRN